MKNKIILLTLILIAYNVNAIDSFPYGDNTNYIKHKQCDLYILGCHSNLICNITVYQQIDNIHRQKIITDEGLINEGRGIYTYGKDNFNKKFGLGDYQSEIYCYNTTENFNSNTLYDFKVVNQKESNAYIDRISNLIGLNPSILAVQISTYGNPFTYLIKNAFQIAVILKSIMVFIVAFQFLAILLFEFYILLLAYKPHHQKPEGIQLFVRIVQLHIKALTNIAGFIIKVIYRLKNTIPFI
jgi:hypothetical protein